MLNYNFQPGAEGPHCGLSFSPSVTDWQAVEGRGSDLPLSLLLFSHPPSRSISCCTVRIDTWIRLRVTPSVLVCLTQQQQLFLKTSPSLRQFLVNVCLVLLKVTRRFYLADFYDMGCERYFTIYLTSLVSLCLCHCFYFSRISWWRLSMENIKDRLPKWCCFLCFSTLLCPRTSTPAAQSRPAAPESCRIATHTNTQTHTRECLWHRCEFDGWHGPTADVIGWKSRITQPPPSHLSLFLLRPYLLSSVSLPHRQDRHRLSSLDINGRGERGKWGELSGWKNLWRQEWGVGFLIYGSDFSFVIPWLSLGSWVGGRWGGGEEGAEAWCWWGGLSSLIMCTCPQRQGDTRQQKCCPGRAEQTSLFSRFNCEAACLRFHLLTTSLPWHVFVIIKHLCTFLIESEGDKVFKWVCTCVEFLPFASLAFAGCESVETDSDEIISTKSPLMTTANISYESHRHRCVATEEEIPVMCGVR